MSAFPIFIDVSDRRPLIVGATSLALAKARLILQWSPAVTFASPPLPEIAALREAGKADVIAAEVKPDDLAGRPVVIIATGLPAEDARIAHMARTLGVNTNVPDRPDISNFSLGAIVSRKPVTLAISTNGSAPVLATQLRAKFEQDLHPRIGKLAEFASRHRARVAETIPDATARRAFWSQVFSGCAADLILAGDERLAHAHLEQMLANQSQTPQRPGTVYLIGAGPGDPELLTLKALRLLKSADVILHDGLMGPNVLALARREAHLISVAKTKGQHAKTQAEINRLMLHYARRGQIVVRLKAGDPSVFARGGEEIDMLRAAGIRVEVVPGITAATAAAASLQIPLTHREYAGGLTVLSGHAAGGGLPDFDPNNLAALARQDATLAVYMGLSTGWKLAAALIDAGWSKSTSVVVVARVSQPGERRVALTLGDLAATADGLDLKGPALILIGRIMQHAAAGKLERFFPSQKAMNALIDTEEHHGEQV